MELATFGEVLYAFSALRSTGGRRRGGRIQAELLPWQNIMAQAPEAEPAPPVPKAAASPAARREDPVSAKPVTRARRASGRCQCGQCRTCQENARWERIFQEKFASSEYYNPEIRIRYASPLSSV